MGEENGERSTPACVQVYRGEEEMLGGVPRGSQVLRRRGMPFPSSLLSFFLFLIVFITSLAFFYPCVVGKVLEGTRHMGER